MWLTLGLRLVTVTLALLAPRLCAEAGLAEAVVTGWRVPPLQGSVAATHPLAENTAPLLEAETESLIQKLSPPLTQLLSIWDLCAPTAARARLLV